MRPATPRLALVCVLLGPTAALSGCVDVFDTSEAPHAFIAYDISADGTWIGRAMWETDDELTRVLDATLKARDVTAVSLGLTFTAHLGVPDVDATMFVDARTGEDVLIASACARDKGCETTTLEWGDGSASLPWYGARLIPHLEPVGRDAFRFEAGALNRVFDAARRAEGLVLSPRLPEDGRRAARGFCNLLDDDTVVDLATRTVLECRSRDAPGVIHRLVSGNRPREFKSDPQEWGAGGDAFGRPTPRVGVLPPGADATARAHGFSIGDAHRAALARSETLATLLRAHPEAAIESAVATARVDADALGVATEFRERVELAYVAPGGVGHFVAVTRTLRVVNDAVTSRDYVLDEDASRPPPPAHTWATMHPLPRNLTALAAALVGIAGTDPAWEPRSITLWNDADHADGGAVYRYFIGLSGPDCGDDGACTDHIVVDAATGRVAAARLSADNLRVVLGP